MLLVADLLRRLQRRKEAALAYQRAMNVVTDGVERKYLKHRLDESHSRILKFQETDPPPEKALGPRRLLSQKGNSGNGNFAYPFISGFRFRANFAPLSIGPKQGITGNE
jgi:hypothetical protein